MRDALPACPVARAPIPSRVTGARDAENTCTLLPVAFYSS